MNRLGSVRDYRMLRRCVPALRKTVSLTVVLALVIGAVALMMLVLPPSPVEAATCLVWYCEDEKPAPAPPIGRPRVAVAGEDLNGGDLVPGDEILWSVTVKNLGATLTKIAITDVVPKWTSYVQGSIQGAGANDSASGKMTWYVAELGCGDRVTVSFRSRVDEDVPGGTKIVNQASADCAQTPPGKSATVTLKVAGEPEVSKGESSDPSPKEIAGSEEEVRESVIRALKELFERFTQMFGAKAPHLLDK